MLIVAGFDATRRYPLILEIHDGPVSNYGDRFSAEMELYAAAGYVVLYSNPRGSTSYGEAFADLPYHNYPGQDYDDLISGVDAVIERGYVDEDNLFVTGGSAGGIMTARIASNAGDRDRSRPNRRTRLAASGRSFIVRAWRREGEARDRAGSSRRHGASVTCRPAPGDGLPPVVPSGGPAA